MTTAPKITTKAAKGDYSWVSLRMPEPIRDACKKMRDRIDPADIIEKEGFPHITVKYGLTTDEPDDVKGVLYGAKGGEVEFGKTTLFEHDDQDVLKVSVKSDALNVINERISRLPNEDKYPEYHPHMTLAYLQPGTGKKYKSMGDLDGTTIEFDEVVFEDTKAEKTTIQLLPVDGSSRHSKVASKTPAPPKPRFLPNTKLVHLSADAQSLVRNGYDFSKEGTVGGQLYSGIAVTLPDYVDSWTHIAKLGGTTPVWVALPPGKKLLDFYATFGSKDPSENKFIVEWARKQGRWPETTRKQVAHYDEDGNIVGWMDDEDPADYDDGVESREYAGFSSDDHEAIFHAYVEQEIPQACGVWYWDTDDPAGLSAPQGIILKKFAPELRFSKTIREAAKQGMRVAVADRIWYRGTGQGRKPTDPTKNGIWYFSAEPATSLDWAYQTHGGDVVVQGYRLKTDQVCRDFGWREEAMGALLPDSLKPEDPNDLMSPGKLLVDADTFDKAYLIPHAVSKGCKAVEFWCGTYDQPELLVWDTSILEPTDRTRMPGKAWRLAAGTEVTELGFEVETNAKPVTKDGLLALREEVAAAANVVLSQWEQDGDGVDAELGTGGACDLVARAIGEVLAGHGYDVSDGGQEGDGHAYIIAYDGKTAFAIDIHPSVYEEGGGYSWRKKDGAVVVPDDVQVWEVGMEAVDASDYIGNVPLKEGEVYANANDFNVVLADDREYPVAAAIVADGRVFEGRTHYEALEKAKMLGYVADGDDGELVDRRGNVMNFDGSIDLFMTNKGRLINRFKALALGEATGAEDIPEADRDDTDTIAKRHAEKGVTARVSERGDGTIVLDHLNVQRDLRKQGLGTAFMEELCSYADRRGKDIELSLGDKTPGETTSKGRLIRFYSRFGFVRNFGRTVDYRRSCQMYRRPRGAREAGSLGSRKPERFDAGYFCRGYCPEFAIALHKATGWPIVVFNELIKDEDEGEEYGVLAHAACRSPDGRYADARGLRDEATIAANMLGSDAEPLKPGEWRVEDSSAEDLEASQEITEEALEQAYEFIRRNGKLWGLDGRKTWNPRKTAEFNVTVAKNGLSLSPLPPNYYSIGHGHFKASLWIWVGGGLETTEVSSQGASEFSNHYEHWDDKTIANNYHGRFEPATKRCSISPPERRVGWEIPNQLVSRLYSEYGPDIKFYSDEYAKTPVQASGDFDIIEKTAAPFYGVKDNDYSGQHDYDPHGEYEEDTRRTMMRKTFVDCAKEIVQSHMGEFDGVFKRFRLFFSKHDDEAVAKYINGTYSEPVVVVDLDKHEEAYREFKDVANRRHFAMTSLMHELWHAMQDASRGMDDDFDEDEAEEFAHRFAAGKEKLSTWFGGSKAVDADGKPLVVYHGSSKPMLENFSKEFIGSGITRGLGPKPEYGCFFFTSDPENAEFFADYRDLQELDPELVSSYGSGDEWFYDATDEEGNSVLNQGPFKTPNDAENAGREHVVRYNAALKRNEDMFVRGYYLKMTNPLEIPREQFISMQTSPAMAAQAAKAKGHDGVIIRDVQDGAVVADTYIVFNGNQVMPSWLVRTAAAKPATPEELSKMEFDVPEGGSSITPKRSFEWRDQMAKGPEEGHETLADLASYDDQWRFENVLGKGWESCSETPNSLGLAPAIKAGRKIKVFRATDTGGILPGAYVTESLTYARNHGKTQFNHRNWRIYSIDVNPDELVSLGDPHEFIYVPRTPEDAHQRLEKGSKPIRAATSPRFDIKTLNDEPPSVSGPEFEEGLAWVLDPPNAGGIAERMVGKERVIPTSKTGGLSEPPVDIIKGQYGSIRYVWKEDGNPVGAVQVVVDGRRATIANAYVLPEYRRKGIATKLFEVIKRKHPGVTMSSSFSHSGAGLVGFDRKEASMEWDIIVTGRLNTETGVDDAPASGHLDTQMFEDCKGTKFDRDVVGKNRRRNKHKRHKKASENDDADSVLDFPMMRQPDGNECGHTCLSMVLQYYGISARLDEITAEAPADENKNGLEAQTIVEIAREYGAEAVITRDFEVEDIKASVDKGVPVILGIQAWPANGEDPTTSWECGHYVVAIGYNAKGIILADPALSNKAILGEDELVLRWRDYEGNEKKEKLAIVVTMDGETFDSDKIVKIAAEEDFDIVETFGSKWIPVSGSSAIKAVAYFEPLGMLEFKMANGREYSFRDIPQAEFEAFKAAESKGKWFSAFVRRYRQAKELPDGRVAGFDVQSPGMTKTASKWGSAGSGVLYHCPTDGTILLLERSGQVEDAGTWGIPGGAIKGTEGWHEEDEKPPQFDEDELRDSAHSETEEEIGHLPDGPVDAGSVTIPFGTFNYTTFRKDVTPEQKAAIDKDVELNWESVDFGWFPVADLPQNTHPGVVEAVKRLFGGGK